MATKKSPKKKNKIPFVIIYMGPVGGYFSTAVLKVPDPFPKGMSAVFHYLNEARHLRNEQKVVLDFFREAMAGMAEEEMVRLSKKIKENWDNMDTVSVISETGSGEPKESEYKCVFERMCRFKEMVSKEVNQMKKFVLAKSPLRQRCPSPSKEPMDLWSFTAKYEKKIDKIEATLSSFMESVDQFQEEIKKFPQPVEEEEPRFYIDYRKEPEEDPLHHKMIIHEGLVKRVENISAAALLILKYTSDLELKLKERIPDLYDSLQKKKLAVLGHTTLQPPHENKSP